MYCENTKVGTTVQVQGWFLRTCWLQQGHCVCDVGLVDGPNFADRLPKHQLQAISHLRGSSGCESHHRDGWNAGNHVVKVLVRRSVQQVRENSYFWCTVSNIYVQV